MMTAERVVEARWDHDRQPFVVHWRYAWQQAKPGRFALVIDTPPWCQIRTSPIREFSPTIGCVAGSQESPAHRGHADHDDDAEEDRPERRQSSLRGRAARLSPSASPAPASRAAIAA